MSLYCLFWQPPRSGPVPVRLRRRGAADADEKGESAGGRRGLLQAALHACMVRLGMTDMRQEPDGCPHTHARMHICGCILIY